MKWNLLFSLAQPCTCPRPQDLVGYQDWKGWNLQKLQDSAGQSSSVLRATRAYSESAAPAKTHGEPWAGTGGDCLPHSRTAPQVRCQHILERKSWVTATWVQSHRYSSTGNAGDWTQNPLLDGAHLSHGRWAVPLCIKGKMTENHDSIIYWAGTEERQWGSQALICCKKEGWSYWVCSWSADTSVKCHEEELIINNEECKLASKCLDI